MPEEAHHPELAATEAALASLAPLPGQLDRDQLMFRAGQASATRRHWLWPAATSAIALLSTGLGLALVLQPAPQQITHVVYVPVEAPSSPTLPLAYSESPSTDATGSQSAERPLPLSSYQLEQLALRFGVELRGCGVMRTVVVRLERNRDRRDGRHPSVAQQRLGDGEARGDYARR